MIQAYLNFVLYVVFMPAIALYLAYWILRIFFWGGK